MPQFITPVAGRLTQPFIAGSHEGVDIGAPDHSTVVAAQSGKVIFEGIWGAGGNTIIIKGNDGWETYYCHLSKFIVNMGASVTQGQAIAQSGGALGEQGAGNATGPHLHFEIHSPNGNAIDPQTFILVGGAQALNVMPIAPQTGVMGSINNTITNTLGAAGLNQAGAAADTTFTAGKSLLGWSEYAAKAGQFLTTKSNWQRVGLFAAGASLIGIVLVKTLSDSDAVKSATSIAAKAA